MCSLLYGRDPIIKLAGYIIGRLLGLRCFCLYLGLSLLLPNVQAQESLSSEQLLAARSKVTVHIFEPTPHTGQNQCVILLHGLARSAKSMQLMQEALVTVNYRVANVDYPSREFPIEVLAPAALDAGIDACGKTSPIHVVTHSLGGILVRAYLTRHEFPQLQHVVMLAPPNQGSHVVDNLGMAPGYAWINGPAGAQLGTDDASVPAQLQRLGPVTFNLGVIAGDRTNNIFLSQLLPNPDDGKVSVANTKVAGMRDFLLVHRTHTFIMQAADVIAQTLHFLATGQFSQGVAAAASESN